MTINVTDQDLKRIISEAVSEVLSNPEVHCRYNIDPEQHKKEHEAVQRFIDLMDNIGKIRFAVVKALVVTAAIGLAGLAWSGVIQKIAIAIGGLMPK